MADTIVLELHYPSNWAYEGEVDVLWCEGANGAERSYGFLAPVQSVTLIKKTGTAEGAAFS